MKSQIVVVFGPTRSGKDTFIHALMERLALTPKSPLMLHVSSIAVVKEFFGRIGAELGTSYPLTPEIRQGLSDVKKVLDRHFDWTVEYAIRRLGLLERSGPGVLLYQVREVENIRKLREACQDRFGVVSVFVNRPDEPRALGADSDVYRDGEPFEADVVVQNRDLADLDIWVDAVARHVLRKFEGEPAC